MIDYAPLARRWRGGPLEPWADTLLRDVEQAFRHGDLPRWRAALSALPDLQATHIDLNANAVFVGDGVGNSVGDGAGDSDNGTGNGVSDGVGNDLGTKAGGNTGTSSISNTALRQLETALRELHPWRKGPFNLFGLPIDTEWRSDWKWDRLATHIQSLNGRRVLDVGASNGYHCWRMRGAGAAEVVGIDPTLLFVMQFWALQKYIQDWQVWVLPLGIEQLPTGLAAFDTVFSMGLLHHRRDPIEHLQTLRGCLQAGGELVLETLVVEGDAQHCLRPEGRYAQMGNVWCLPSCPMLLGWLEDAGFDNPRLADVNVTTVAEQRSTDWMRFHSLAQFLDPTDSTRTIEGHPAPRRGLFIASKP